MIWDYKNNELKQFIQKKFSIKEASPDTIEHEGRIWVKTRRIKSVYENKKTGEQQIIDNDLYEFEHGKAPDKNIVVDGTEFMWIRNISGFATFTDTNGILKRAHSMKFETKFTKPPLDGSDFPYGVT